MCRANFKRKHYLNGGSDGLNRINWTSFVDGTDLILSHATDGSDGFPAVLLVQIRFSVKPSNTLIVKAMARTNKTTPVDLSHRMYFNLASHDAGCDEMEEHLALINSKQFYDGNSDGTFDENQRSCNLTTKQNIGELMKSFNGDTSKLFVVDKNSECNYNKEELPLAARLIHSKSGRVLEIRTNQPTFSFSTCPHFPVGELSEKQEDSESLVNLTLEYLRTKLTEKEI